LQDESNFPGWRLSPASFFCFTSFFFLLSPSAFAPALTFSPRPSLLHFWRQILRGLFAQFVHQLQGFAIAFPAMLGGLGE
jgi:hypothetical protein